MVACQAALGEGWEVKMSQPEVQCGLPVVLVKQGAGASEVAACVPSGFLVVVDLGTDVLGLEFLLGRCMVAVTRRR